MWSYFSFEAGLLEDLWDGDKSKISFLILSLGVYFFGKLGLAAYLWDKPDSRWKFSHKWLDEGFEAAQSVMTLGMMGTIIGFIMMLGSFASVDVSDATSIQQLFASSTEGMSTALYTTLTGLGTHLLLRTSYWIFEKRITP
jgi:hypothetical protein